MNPTLPMLPGAAGLYVRALGTTRRKPGKNIRIPKLEVSVAAVQASSIRLEAYRSICGFETREDLPISFPQVQAAPLHLWLMLQAEFPIPLMGLVHLRNSFERLAPMPADGAYDVRAALLDGRRTHQGYEFDILTEYTDTDGQAAYRSLMTLLYRQKTEGGPYLMKSKPAASRAGLAEYRSFEVPADMGRRYAPIGGDFNPIHLGALSARLFGFPRAIAHGMWSVARAAALVESARGRAATRLTVQFKQPLLLPAKVSLRFCTDGGGVTGFALLSQTSDKEHFSGSLR
ncbi:MAG: MaoC family dehydratase [Panacagrimonas sp.]